MGLRVAPASLHSVLQAPSSSQTLASSISSPSFSRRRTSIRGDAGALFCRYVDKSAFFCGAHHHSSKLCWSRSCANRTSRVRTIRRAMAASLDSFSDEEFSKKIQELAARFQLSEDDDDTSVETPVENLKRFEALEPPDFPDRGDIIPANIEMKANSVDIPLSLRMIKQKKQWQEGFMEAGENARCSVKKAFSSMVFIIRELHSYTLQMREILFYEDLQGILASVQKEMHASFVWLFQKVFSQTPTLMMYLMILLANYSVYSMSTNVALAAVSPMQGHHGVVSIEQVSMVDEDYSPSKEKFDSSVVKALKLSYSNNGGGGGKYKPIASGMDGDGKFDESNHQRTVTPDEASAVSANPSRTSEEVSVSRQASIEKEDTLWDSFVEEASRMQAASRDGALDQETIQRFVSPVHVEIESDDHSEHMKMELLYQTELAQEPNNPLLLANYAQFIYLVAQDFDRAEEYFKRAIGVEPKDAEAFNKYANFLWVVRNDIWAAEETYLEAISAEPDNSFYAANYAHFLWNTGGEDTCFPLSPPDSSVDV